MNRCIQVSYHQHCNADTRIYNNHGRIENHNGYPRTVEQYHQLYLQDGNSIFLKLYTGSQTAIYQKWYDEEFHHMYSIDYPGIPKYYSVQFCESNIPYPAVCMEYIKGISLADYLAQARACNPRLPNLYLTPAQYYHILEQLLGILTTLKQHHVLYLDLNPENIIICNKHFDIAIVDYTFCRYTDIDMDSLNNNYTRCSCRYIDTNLNPENLMTQVVAYFNAFILYGGSVESLIDSISSSAIDYLLNQHFTGYNFLLSTLYPDKWTQYSDMQNRQNRFFKNWPSMEAYLHTFLELLSHPR
jgi:serine/threonine protein kinase